MTRMRRIGAIAGLWVVLGGLGLATGALLPTPASAHPCSQDECDSFFIFWERCENNAGQNTGCEVGDDGCTTIACGHA